MNETMSLYPMITECIVNLVKAGITVVFAMLVIPWLKNVAIPWLKDKRLYGMICKFVRAAEKLADTGAIDKQAKLDYVTGLLQHWGVEMTPEIRAMIESAVGDLDDEFLYNMANMAEIFVEDEEEEPEEERDVEPVDDPEEAPAE